MLIGGKRENLLRIDVVEVMSAVNLAHAVEDLQ